jgi:prepilin-type N-terminal cleavage/methylation domain-containing protein
VSRDVPRGGRAHSPPGFTLVELLAATALSTVLMLAVLQVLGTLGRSRSMMEKQAAAAAPWREDLTEMLRRDLGGATGVRYAPNGIVLAGHAALRPGSLAPTDEPVTVTYGLAEIHGRNWLYRRQVGRAGVSGAGEPWTELLCPDVAGFEVSPAGALVPVDPKGGDKSELQPLPAAASVRVMLADGSVIEQVLALR